jgi:hypothetical protein
MNTRAVIAALVAAILPVFWVANCSGPEPKVAEVRLHEPTQEGGPYRVEALIENEGPGHGQVEIMFRLVNRATGQTVEEDKESALEPHERTLVTVEIKAPKADYEPRVEVEYPPR